MALEKVIRVLFLPPGGEAEVRELAASDAAYRAELAGQPTWLALTHELALWCRDDEEGPVNLEVARFDGVHNVHGPAFIARHDGEGEPYSLSGRQVERARALVRQRRA